MNWMSWNDWNKDEMLRRIVSKIWVIIKIIRIYPLIKNMLSYSSAGYPVDGVYPNGSYFPIKNNFQYKIFLEIVYYNKLLLIYI